MKVTTHNYSNDVFSSLLEGLKKDFILEKKASSESNIKDTQNMPNVFSSTTSEDMSEYQKEELEKLADELVFAAEKSHISVTAQDLAKFAKICIGKQLRGKAVEREAQKYCNQINRSISEPKGETKLSSLDLVNEMSSHKVISASYPVDSESGILDSKAGKYLGCLKNPNTIWDSELMTKKATEMMNDEKMEVERKKLADYKKSVKESEKTKDINPDDIIQNKIINSGISESNNNVHNPKIGINSMSIFDKDRDFNAIAEKTEGEKIAQDSLERAQKKSNSKSEWNQVKGATKTRSVIDTLFDNLSI